MYTIKVTEKHIQEGWRKACYGCPIFLAVVDGMNEEEKGGTFSVLPACVAPEFIRRGKERFRPPAEVNEFIRRFDAGLPVEPFEFQLSEVMS